MFYAFRARARARKRARDVSCENSRSCMPSNPEKPEEKEFEEKEPDRPIECGDCKKPIAAHYTELVGKNIVRTSMCADCPILEGHLCGLRGTSEDAKQKSDGTGLACGNCGTTLEALRVGAPLGCSTCYEVFEEFIIKELLTTEKIPSRLSAAKKTQALHFGRIQGAAQEISSSMRLLALNEALNETLQREDYEQAALLRDQIKALTEDQQQAKGREDAN